MERSADRSLKVYSSEGGNNGLFMANAGKAGVIEDNSQTALLWMLKLGWYSSDEMRDEALAMLVENIRNENPDPGSVRAQYGKNTLAVGFLGSNVITPVLSDAGRSDVSYDLLLSTEMPSWLFEVRSGATSIWERWNSYDRDNGFGDAEMNSFNHFAYGSVAEWMYRYMAGIESENGFKNIILQPTLDKGTKYNDEERIRSVSGQYDSFYGTVRSDWTADENAVLTEYHAVIPANTSATLYLPVSAESVRGFVNIPGVSFLGMEQHNGGLKAKFALESGGYDFTVTDGRLSAALAKGYEAVNATAELSAPYLALTADGELAVEYVVDFNDAKAGNDGKYCAVVEYLESGEWKPVGAETELTLSDGRAAVAFVPENSNVPYRLSAYIKSAAGAVSASASAAGTTLYELVIDDIVTSGYTSPDELDRDVLAKANAVIGKGGLVGIDALDSVRARLMEKPEGKTDTVVIRPQFAELGIGFVLADGKLYVGSVCGEGETSVVYTGVTLDGGKVTLTGRDSDGLAIAETLSLDAVQIEFVETLIETVTVESAAAGQEFVPEL